MRVHYVYERLRNERGWLDHCALLFFWCGLIVVFLFVYRSALKLYVYRINTSIISFNVHFRMSNVGHSMCLLCVAHVCGWRQHIMPVSPTDFQPISHDNTNRWWHRRRRQWRLNDMLNRHAYSVTHLQVTILSNASWCKTEPQLHRVQPRIMSIGSRTGQLQSLVLLITSIVFAVDTETCVEFINIIHSFILKLINSMWKANNFIGFMTKWSDWKWSVAHSESQTNAH